MKINFYYSIYLILLALIISNPALSQGAEIRLNKNIYAPGESISIFYSNFPAAGKGNDWISLAQEDHPKSKYTRFKYLHGKTQGELILKIPNLQKPGRYEVRGYFDWPKGGYSPKLCIPLIIAENAGQAAEFEKDSNLCNVTHGVVANSSLRKEALIAATSSPESISKDPVSQFDYSLPKPGLDNHWFGYIECIQSVGRRKNIRNIPFFLDFNSKDSPNISLHILDHYGPSVNMNLNRNNGINAFSLEATSWIYNSRTVTEPPKISAKLNSSGLHFSGTISLNPNMSHCKNINAFKYSRDSRPLHKKGVVSNYDLRSAALERDIDICRNHINYMTSGTAIETQGEIVPSQIMDGDAFYTYFGKPYSNWTKDDSNIVNQLTNGCRNALNQSSQIKDTSLVNKLMTNKRALHNFLHLGLPAKNPNQRQHYAYLKNYSLIIALRNANLYLNLLHDEAKSLSANLENLTRLDKDISTISNGEGIFKALSKNNTPSVISSMKSIRDNMSVDILNSSFERINFSEYEYNLSGLKRALKAKQHFEEDAKKYANSNHISKLDHKFNEKISPISKEVADRTIDSIKVLKPTVNNFIEGKKEKEKVSKDVVPYLSSPDKQRVNEAYNLRNKEIALKLLPEFSTWLNENIPGDASGKSKLNNLSISILDTDLSKLNLNLFSSPYRELAAAILNRNEKLTFQKCEVPAGFEDLAEEYCAEQLKNNSN